MGANYNSRINILVGTDAQAVRRAGFGTILLLDSATTFASGVHKTFESNADAQADTELSADAKAACAAFFSQTLRPKRIAVGEIAAYTDQPTTNAALDAIVAAGLDFYGVCPTTHVEAELVYVAVWVLANQRLGALQSEDADILSGTTPNAFDTLNDAGNGRVFGVYADDDEWHALCALTQILAVDPDETVTIASYKTLQGQTPSDVTSTEKTAVESVNGNLYLTAGGVGAFGKGVLFDGRKIDTLISKDWIRARMEEALTQLQLDMSNLNRRIPFDDTGIAMVVSVVRSRLLRGELIGHFRPDSSVVSAPALVDVDPADVTARIIRIQADTILTGAIEDVSLSLAVLTA